MLSLKNYNTYEDAVHALNVEGFYLSEKYDTKREIWQLFKKGKQVLALISSTNYGRRDYEYVHYLIRRVK